MKYDKFGQIYATTDELCEILYQNPDQDLSNFKVESNPLNNYVDALDFNLAVKKYYTDFPFLERYQQQGISIENFDSSQQSNWYMPDEYKSFDIAAWVLDQCKTQEELQRVGEELFLYQERELFPLLKYLKYFVDTMRKNNVVWGVGRGSSTASYVLYLIGVHRIDSIFFDLPINEFLK